MTERVVVGEDHSIVVSDDCIKACSTNDQKIYGRLLLRCKGDLYCWKRIPKDRHIELPFEAGDRLALTPRGEHEGLPFHRVVVEVTKEGPHING